MGLDSVRINSKSSVKGGIFSKSVIMKEKGGAASPYYPLESRHTDRVMLTAGQNRAKAVTVLGEHRREDSRESGGLDSFYRIKGRGSELLVQPSPKVEDYADKMKIKGKNDF